MLRIAVLVLAGAVLAPAHDVITTKLTWSAEISRIVYRRCVSCHRDGGRTPMSLTTYEDVRPWAKAIRDEVLARRMPPWGAIRGYGDLRHDPSLTQDEITRIAEWVEGGAPEGDPKYLPAAVPAPKPEPKCPPGVRIRTALLSRDAVLLGIRPMADVPEARVYARRPDGTVEPLLWLHGYKSAWNRTFVMATPLNMPRGSSIVSEPAVSLELLVKSPQQGH